MNEHERKLFNVIRDMKPDNPHYRRKIDMVPELANRLAIALSKTSMTLISVQQTYAQGIPFSIIGRYVPMTNGALSAIASLFEKLGAPIPESYITELDFPMSMFAFDVIASIDVEWQITLTPELIGGPYDGATRRWANELGLQVIASGTKAKPEFQEPRGSV